MYIVLQSYCRACFFAAEAANLLVLNAGANVIPLDWSASPSQLEIITTVLNVFLDRVRAAAAESLKLTDKVMTHMIWERGGKGKRRASGFARPGKIHNYATACVIFLVLSWPSSLSFITSKLLKNKETEILRVKSEL